MSVERKTVRVIATLCDLAAATNHAEVVVLTCSLGADLLNCPALA